MAGENQSTFYSGSQDHSYWFRAYLSLYFAPAVSAIGISLNIYAFWFLCRTRTVSGVYLRLLMITDISQLVLGLAPGVNYFCEITIGAGKLTPSCLVFWRLVSPVIDKVVVLSDTIHLWTVTALTVHRYWKVSNPILSHIHDTKPFACCVLFTVILSAVLYRLPTFFELDLMAVPNLANISFYTFVDSSLKNNESYDLWYSAVSNLIAYSIVPYTILVVLDVLILRAIKQSAYDPLLHARSRLRSRERRAAASVVFIGTVFLLFHTIIVFDVMKKLVRHFRHKKVRYNMNQYRTMNDVSNVLMMLCSAVNPVVYINVDSMFGACIRSIRVEDPREGADQRTHYELQTVHPQGRLRYQRRSWPRGIVNAFASREIGGTPPGSLMSSSRELI